MFRFKIDVKGKSWKVILLELLQTNAIVYIKRHTICTGTPSTHKYSLSILRSYYFILMSFHTEIRSFKNYFGHSLTWGSFSPCIDEGLNGYIVLAEEDL